MRVYHFLNKKYGLESIVKRRLKISKFSDLNDPFELYAFSLKEKDFRRAWKAWMELYSSERGIICLSKNWNNPLLWGHYADKHTGICLGFDISDKILREIDYIEERPNPQFDNFDVEESFKILFSKYIDWKYEEELRLLLSLVKSKIKNGYYFEKYSHIMKLSEIIIGCEADISRKEVSDAMCNNFPEIKPFKARAAFNTFKIIKQKKQSLWN